MVDTLFLSVTTPHEMICEFDPRWNSRRAAWMNYLIPIQVSRGVNWKFAGWASGNLWCWCSMGLTIRKHEQHPDNFFTVGSGLFDFTRHWENFIGMNRGLPPIHYPVLFIHAMVHLYICIKQDHHYYTDYKLATSWDLPPLVTVAMSFKLSILTQHIIQYVMIARAYLPLDIPHNSFWHNKSLISKGAFSFIGDMCWFQLATAN